ncbi:N-acetylmuramoyl-L-alanine amidase [Bacillus paralicheniformis]|nr:N-acetylmuramoyl-L-alanine amidase [Bacillus paralicheniformis]
MKGTTVRQIQEALAALYSNQTKMPKITALMAFTGECGQMVPTMHGLSADGIYGPKTKAKIESLLK